MSDTAELTRRRELLLRRCALERARMTDRLLDIVEPLAKVDRRLDVVQRWTSRPMAIAAGVGLTLLAARFRSSMWFGALAGIASQLWRLRSSRSTEPTAR